MEPERKGFLGRAFGNVAKPFAYVNKVIRQQIGYDVAMRGWENDEPMSGPSRKSRAVRDVFSKHAKRGPALIVAPTMWAEVARDLSKALAPTKDSKLLPKFQYTTFEEDLARFKPNDRLKERLKESTAMDTSRSFMRSSLTILSMYWTKAGVKEATIGASLAAATLYCTLKSVDVQAAFSYWGRDFNDFLVQAFATSGEIKSTMLDSMKTAFEMNLYDSDLALLKTIITESNYSFENMDVTSAISDIRIAPVMLQELADSISQKFGDLSLERFAQGQNVDQLEALIKELAIPKEHMDTVIKQITDAIVIEADVKQAGQIIIEKAAEHFGTMSPEHLSVLDGAVNEFNTIEKQLQTLGIQVVDNLNLQLILSQNGPAETYNLLTSALSNFDITTLDQDKIGPEKLEFLQQLHATLSAEIAQSPAEKIAMLGSAQEGHAVIKDLGQLMTEDIFNTTLVDDNVEHLTTEVPQSFSKLLGKFLMYALPASYTAQHLALRWQTFMTGKMSNELLKYGAAYKLKYQHANIDNPDQRISENLSGITNFATDMTTDGMQNALTLMAFIPILNAMGDFNPAILGGPDIMIDNFMTWAAFGWATAAAVALGAISYSLPGLGRQAQHARGDFRGGLISVNSQPEQISLAKGEKIEKGILKKIHRKVVDIDVKFINKRMQIQLFNSVQGNIGNYLPYMFTVPLGMGAMLTFGQAMQAAGIFRMVESSIEFVKRSIPSAAAFKADVDRSAQLIDGVELTKYEILEKEYYRRLQDNDLMPPPTQPEQLSGPAM